MINYENLLNILNENGDKKYDDFNRKVTNTGIRSIGCTTPFIRKLAKRYNNVEDAMSLPVGDYYEIDLLKGIIVSNSDLPFEEKSRYLLQFADTIENWAVCDCSTVSVSKNEKREYLAFFKDMLKSDKVFVCRYGIVNLLSNYLDNEHIEDVFASLQNVQLYGNYYVDMAVAWLIATAMAKCRDHTKEYMEGKGKEVLNVFTYNKALQKMRDSFRVSAEDKEWTKQIKRYE